MIPIFKYSVDRPDRVTTMHAEKFVIETSGTLSFWKDGRIIFALGRGLWLTVQEVSCQYELA